jgi:inner membrane protein
MSKMTKPEDQRPWQSNLRVRLVGADRGKKSHYDFDVAMKVAGTQRLSVGPVGDLNEISLASSWPSPLFAGRFLPRAPEVGASGFKAAWSLSSLAAATQQQIVTSTNEVDTLNVSLLTPVDPYKLSDRATKYGILFVVLTFGGFFLFEMMKHLPIHPVQYLLVGFGLAMFFLLLISFSEHMAFGAAYVLASATCIGLLTFYLSYVLRSVMRGLGFGVMLTALYSAVYGLLISEDNSLILGSVMLFAVLTSVMVVTRKVDWYKSGPEALGGVEADVSAI